MLHFCVTVIFGPDESKANLEESPLITTIVCNPEDKPLVKKVSQKIQEYYFGDRRITYAPDSGIVDVSSVGVPSDVLHLVQE
jgi:hypothetical protein